MLGYDETRWGTVWFGLVWQGKSRSGQVEVVFGMARIPLSILRGMALLDSAWLGQVLLGRVWSGEKWHGEERHGMAGSGEARPGEVWCGESRLAEARCGLVRNGVVWHGEVRLQAAALRFSTRPIFSNGAPMQNCGFI